MGARLDVVETKHDPGAVAGWVDWFVPPPLTRRRIVHVALSLVNESGLRRLTFDGLAGHLSVTPEVLCHHVADRAELIPRVRTGGLIIADNVLQGGRVADPEASGSAVEGIRRFNTMALADPRLDVVVLTISDGVSILQKRPVV